MKVKLEIMKLTKESSLESIKTYVSDNDDLYDEFRDCAGGGDFEDKELGTVKYEDREGFRADGQSYTEVFSFLDRFFGVPCTYSSWGDSEFELGSLFEVVPKKVTVTRWEQKKD